MLWFILWCTTLPSLILVDSSVSLLPKSSKQEVAPIGQWEFIGNSCSFRHSQNFPTGTNDHGNKNIYIWIYVIYLYTYHLYMVHPNSGERGPLPCSGLSQEAQYAPTGRLQVQYLSGPLGYGIHLGCQYGAWPFMRNHHTAFLWIPRIAKKLNMNKKNKQE